MTYIPSAKASGSEAGGNFDQSRREFLPILAFVGTPIFWSQAASAQIGNGLRRQSVIDFGADPSGQRDSSLAFSNAIEQLDIIEIPAGRFLVGDVVLRSGIEIVGVGEQSIVIQKPGASYVLSCDSGSSDPAVNLKNITLKNFQLRGSCDVDGFSEFIHLLSLNGVSNTTIDGVVFRGFRGDGLYLGSSNRAAVERHNLHIAIRNCVFDGINHENRNAISVIDCSGLTIAKCRFINVSRSNMPGAIDLEPNASSFHVIQDVRISENQFSDIGGNVGVISMYIPTQLAQMPSKILVERNRIENAAAAAFSFIQRPPPSNISQPQLITIRQNQATGKQSRPFNIQGVVGIELSDNQFENSSQSGLIGYRNEDAVVREMVLRGNVFKRCGLEGGVGISIFTVSKLEFLKNVWQDCGNGKPASYGVDFNVGKSEHVTFAGNIFRSPEGKPLIAIQKEAAHTFIAESNIFTPDNLIDAGMRNAFEAKVHKY